MMIKKYKMIQKIGKGSFGDVMLAQNEEQQVYAVKEMHLDGKKKKQMGQQIQNECKIMGQVHCENIVKLKQVVDMGHRTYIIMEYCAQRDLKNYYEHHAKPVFTLKQAAEIVLQIINGVEHLHAAGYIHRDIKMENIFVQTNHIGNKVFKLGDFGLSTSDLLSYQVVGSPCYMSPEILKMQGYGFEVDVWALGVLLYYLLNGEYPFKISLAINSLQSPLKNLLQMASNFSYRSKVLKSKNKIIENCTQEVENLFSQLFKILPQERIGLKQLKKILTRIIYSQFIPSGSELPLQKQDSLFAFNIDTTLKKIKKGPARKRKQISNSTQSSKDSIKAVKQKLFEKQTQNQMDNANYLKQIQSVKSASFTSDDLLDEKEKWEGKVKKIQQKYRKRNSQIQFLWQIYKGIKEELIENENIEKIQKNAAFYNITHYYLILKQKLVKQLEQLPQNQILTSMEREKLKNMESYQSLKNWINIEYENAKRQHRIFYCECAKYMEQIRKINKYFSQNARQTISEKEKFGGTFKFSYRRSMQILFEGERTRNPNNKNYLLITFVLLAFVYNRAMEDLQWTHSAFQGIALDECESNSEIDLIRMCGKLKETRHEQLKEISGKIRSFFIKE